MVHVHTPYVSMVLSLAFVSRVPLCVSNTIAGITLILLLCQWEIEAYHFYPLRREVSIGASCMPRLLYAIGLVIISHPGGKALFWQLNLRMCIACLKLWYSWAWEEFDGIIAGPHVSLTAHRCRVSSFRLNVWYPQTWRPLTGCKHHQAAIVRKVVGRAGRKSLVVSQKGQHFVHERMRVCSHSVVKGEGALKPHSHSMKTKVSISQSFNTVYLFFVGGDWIRSNSRGVLVTWSSNEIM